MVRNTRHRNGVEFSPSADKPVVGLVTTGADDDWVAAEIIHAKRNGHQVIVTGTTRSDWRIYAEALDAICLDGQTELTDDRSPRKRLVEEARKRGFPGLLLHAGEGNRLDLERSIRKLSATNSYAIDAITESGIVEDTRVLCGIPAYDEAPTIGAVVEEVSEFVDDVLVVDDGSEDATAREAREAGATVIKHRANRGYGAALKTIFERADLAGVDHLVVLDADSQHDPADIPALVETQRKRKADLVIGSRFADGGTTNAPFYRQFGLFVVNVLTNLSFGAVRPGTWVKDTQSGFRAYSRDVVSTLAASEDIDDRMGASTDILGLARRHDYDVVEVGTTIDYEVEGANSHHPITHGISLVRNLYRTIEDRRPLSVLGVPGFASWFCGLWFGYLALATFQSTGSLPIELGVLSAVFTLAGVMACFAGVVLHALARFDD